jgi:hypothetical protein
LPRSSGKTRIGVANEEVENGVTWVYGLAEDGIIAFTDFGIENLMELVKIRKEKPKLLRF